MYIYILIYINIYPNIYLNILCPKKYSTYIYNMYNICIN
jgi:hypothetical protein